MVENDMFKQSRKCHFCKFEPDHDPEVCSENPKNKANVAKTAACKHEWGDVVDGEAKCLKCDATVATTPPGPIVNRDCLTKLLKAAQRASAVLGRTNATEGERAAAKIALDEPLNEIREEAEKAKNYDPDFDGEVYDPAQDKDRLTKQIGRIFDLMSDGRWRTLDEISAATGSPHASISAQLRHLRKPRFGSYRVEKRPRNNREEGLFEYQLLAADGMGIKAIAVPPP